MGDCFKYYIPPSTRANSVALTSLFPKSTATETGAHLNGSPQLGNPGSDTELIIKHILENVFIKTMASDISSILMSERT